MPNKNKPHHTPLKIEQPTLPFTSFADEHRDIFPLARWHDVYQQAFERLLRDLKAVE